MYIIRMPDQYYQINKTKINITRSLNPNQYYEIIKTKSILPDQYTKSMEANQ